jgi:hypothetical protein
VSTAKGSRKTHGFADHVGMKKFWSGEETRRNGDELFRVKVVGSTPTGPTTRRTGLTRAEIFNTLWELKKRAQRQNSNTKVIS